MKKVLSTGNFEELNGLRKNLAEKKRMRKNLKIELRGNQDYFNILRRDLGEKFANYKKNKENELKDKRHQMNIDKELREQEGFTNQKPWEQEVRKRTLVLEKEINQKISNYKAKNDNDLQVAEILIQAKQDEIADLDIEIGDLTWELTLKLEYYKEYQIVQVV